MLRMLEKTLLRWRNVRGYNSIYLFRKNNALPNRSEHVALIEIDMDEYIQLPAELCPWKIDDGILQKFENGRLFVMKRKGEVRCLGWVMHSCSMVAGELASAKIEFGKPVDWIWDCVTPQHLRGRGYYPQMLGLMLRELQNPIIYCSIHNHSSCKGIKKSGFWLDSKITSYPWGIRCKQIGSTQIGFSVKQGNH